jgi:hypothetical protein
MAVLAPGMWSAEGVGIHHPWALMVGQPGEVGGEQRSRVSLARRTCLDSEVVHSKEWAVRSWLFPYGRYFIVAAD